MAFPTNTTVLDDFNRADEGPPMTNWTDLSNGIKVVSNQAAGNVVTVDNSSLYNANTYGPDCEVFATIATTPSSNNHDIGLYARITTLVSTTFDGYLLLVRHKTTGSDEWYIFRVDNATPTLISGPTIRAFAAGDKIGLECVGSNITAYHDNGGGWTSVATVSDSTYSAAGYMGLLMDSTVGRWDDFSGGTQVVAATAIKDVIGHGLVPFKR